MHAIMLARFILSLREIDDPRDSHRTQNPPVDSLDEFGGSLTSYDEEYEIEKYSLYDLEDIDDKPFSSVETMTSLRFAYPDTSTEAASSRYCCLPLK